MGRREKPLEPDAGPVQRFAADLRELRRAAGGPTYRAMARDCAYSAPTLSIAAAGDRLPSLPVALAYVAACGGDAEVWEKRWHAAAADEPVIAHDDGTQAPYPGLARYGTEDSDHFFGRDQLIADLLDIMRRRPVTALVGASGSGKSSLLRAGLVPAVRAQDDAPTVIRIITPCPARIRPELLTEGALVLVDQFEELFTVCRDRAQRDAYIGALLNSPARIVIAIRADFYGRCAENPALAAALTDSVLLVGPMTSEQLREAVTGPATAERLQVERALTTRIVADVGAEPGGLPLMSHALLETWRRRRGRVLTTAAYESIGGIQGAIAHTAEGLFSTFTKAEAGAARALLLRLISPGEATEDTRRPAERLELLRFPESAEVLERLVHARLLTVDDNAVNLAHEALITGWPRLRGWVETDREVLRLHQRLTASARVWEELHRDQGALYRGAQLEAAREAFPVLDVLTAQERTFLLASLRAHDDALRAAARTTRRLRFSTVCLSILLCLAALAGAFAWGESEESDRRAIEAEARRVAQIADTMRVTDPTTALQLSLAAWRLADLPETREALFAAGAQPEVAAFTPPPDFSPGHGRGWRALSADGRTVISLGQDRTESWDVAGEHRLPELKGLDQHRSLGLAPDLRRAAVVSGERIRLWDLAAGRLVGPALGTANNGRPAGWFSPGGDLLASWAWLRGVELRDIRTGRLLLHIDHQRDFVLTLKISSDNRLMAYCTMRGTPQVWDIRQRRKLPTPWLNSIDACRDDAFHFTPDGQAIAVSTARGVSTWEVRSGKQRPRIELSGRSHHLAFSADGAHLAMVADNEILLWRTAHPSFPVLRLPVQGASLFALRLDMARGVIRYAAGAAGEEHAFTVRTIHFGATKPDDWERAPLMSAAYSPDGASLGTVRAGSFELRGSDGALRGRALGAVPPCVSCRRWMAFDRHSEKFAFLDASGRVKVRDLSSGTTEATPPAPPGVTGLTLTDSGGKVVISHGEPADQQIDALTAPPGEKGAQWAMLREGNVGAVLTTGTSDSLITTDRQRITQDIAGEDQFIAQGEGQILSIAVSDDRRLTAMSDGNGRTTLWESEGLRRIAVLSPGEPPDDPGPGSITHALAFSRDGGKLAAGDASGAIRVWDTSAPRSKGVALPPAHGPVLALAFTSDARGLRVTTPHTASRLYSLRAAEMADTVCKRSELTFPAHEWAVYLPSVPHRDICP
ncbi:hypothetical protein [Streptomyces albipurpureus]|uniref:Novel STAND NTPase 1 domain-containing protein n=1 Tax=Streptomyces albipurpureus TaxID=2897419 RepID=A0ABT0UFA2_9ACTN|nr:hypothetical protein [Streptomyces sp. CWNU-1]MCM2387297.1 hypothetical protein [Streptomyces sp. CWNU-1]